MNTKLETSEPPRPPPPQMAVRADNYSYAELADIYNQTRIDYIVPMPMNAKRLEEYVRRYDVNLRASFVSVDGEREPTGVAMLGLRAGRVWITRLGVVPERRGFKTGRLLTDRLLAEAKQRGAWMAQLEVITGNVPALRLFESCGFAPTRELIVSRRPPALPAPVTAFDAMTRVPVEGDALAELLRLHVSDASWIEEARSVLQSGGLRGFHLRAGGENLGWTAYHYSAFQLEHIVLGGRAQHEPDAARALLYHIQKQHPKHDTKVENIPVLGPLWPVFQQAGYIESFRRVEMICKL